ncbi:MAG: CPBP family intramembrane metalloprotease [Shouchella clausii]|jgi:energy-coupling factor transporter transmembrane protein EcfT
MNEKTAKLTPKNKLIAFVLLPLYQIALFLITTSIVMYLKGTWYFDVWGFLGFLTMVLAVCYICNPVFNAFEFNNIFIRNGETSLIEKIKKFKGIFIIFTVVPIIVGLLALNTN